MKKRIWRRMTAAALSLATLWMVASTAESTSFPCAISGIKNSSLAQWIVQWELADFLHPKHLPLATYLALCQSPALLTREVAQLSDADADSSESDADTADIAASSTSTLTEGLRFLDNGSPSETVIPTNQKGYSVVGKVYIKSTSVKSPDLNALAENTFPAALSSEGPQVLIVHTHGSEAYTMPQGQSYKASGEYRTTDTRYNVVKVGDEIASTLSSYGISVLHDREIHDTSYNDAYDRSEESIASYRKKYPSLVFILDIHRDAIADSDGRQYKVVSREEPHAAQISFIMGSDHEKWQDNLKLAVAVQQTLCDSYPTLMRPLTLRNESYNQDASIGSMLVEIGAAGNSLDEAIYAGRLFAQGFAETVLAKK